MNTYLLHKRIIFFPLFHHKISRSTDQFVSKIVMGAFRLTRKTGSVIDTSPIVNGVHQIVEEKLHAS